MINNKKMKEDLFEHLWRYAKLDIDGKIHLLIGEEILKKDIDEFPFEEYLNKDDKDV